MQCSHNDKNVEVVEAPVPIVIEKTTEVQVPVVTEKEKRVYVEVKAKKPRE